MILFEFLAPLTVLFPVFCVLAFLMKWNFRLSFDQRVKLFVLVEAVLIGVSFLSMPWEFPKVTSYLELYIGFMALYAALLMLRTRKICFNYLYPIAGLMVFVAADFWEWGYFIFGSLELFDPSFQLYSGQWFDQIHRIYVLLILAILLKFSGWKPNFDSIFCLVMSILVPLAFFIFAPFPFWDIIVRVVSLGFIGASFYCGVDEFD